MKNLINNVFLIAAFAVLLASCKPELAIPTASKGNLNLTSYVAIGNSLTAGYQDNGLSYKGQQSSYVTLLAQQFKLVEPGFVFNAPYVDPSSVGCGAPNLAISPAIDGANPINNLGKTFTITITVPSPYTLQTTSGCNGIGLSPKSSAGDGKIILGPGYNNQTGETYVWGPITYPPPPFPTIPTAPSIYTGQGFNNMGVAGARAIDVNKKGFGGSKLVDLNSSTLSFSQSNPFFSRFAKDQANSSMLSDAMLMDPSFFSLFIGNNDVLLWASGGGVNSPLTPSITPLPEFSDSIDNIVRTLTKTAKEGIIINISQITGAAFFTYHSPDTSKYIIDDQTLVGRKMTTNDMMLLTVPNDSLECGLKNLQGFAFGSSNYPVPKKYTLTANQVNMITTAIEGYNTKLKAVADSAGLAFFDMNAFARANQNGITYNGMSATGAFVTGGIFSLDGVHLTARGYGALTNGILEAINAKYGSTIPGVDLTKLGGVTFPQ